MQNVLRNLGRRSSTPQDTVNSNSDTIDNSGVLPRGMEHSALLGIELSTIDMYAAAADEGGDMSVGGVSVGRAPRWEHNTSVCRQALIGGGWPVRGASGGDEERGERLNQLEDSTSSSKQG